MEKKRYSREAMHCIFKMVRKGRWGHKVIREEDLPPKNGPSRIGKKGIKELVAAGLLKVKSGLGTRTYSLNPHKKKDIMEIYTYVNSLD